MFLRGASARADAFLLLLRYLLAYIRKILYLCTLLWYLIGFGLDSLSSHS